MFSDDFVWEEHLYLQRECVLCKDKYKITNSGYDREAGKYHLQLCKLHRSPMDKRLQVRSDICLAFLLFLILGISYLATCMAIQGVLPE